MNQYPLIARQDFDSVWIVTDEQRLTVGEVLFRAKMLAQQLPDTPYCLLLCEQRVNFIIGFLACLWRRQAVLLPPNRLPAVTEALLADYPDSCCLTDSEKNSYKVETRLYDYSTVPSGTVTEVPLLDSRQLACMVFTSGSTGKPEANAKFWGDLVQGVNLLQSRYGFQPEDYLVATVPPQHMYGLEMTVLLPMLFPLSVYGHMPFFPEDIRQALQRSDRKGSLISTPLHLKVCTRSGIHWPGLRRLFSATAPLEEDDARVSERSFATRLQEVYGTTESGAIASRTTTEEKYWHLYDGVRLVCEDDRPRVLADHLPHRPVLADRVEIVDDEHFLLHGRSTDMIKIAGKRASLADLNLKLCKIPGIEDGVFVQMDSSPEGISRLCVVMVAPDLSQADVIQALAIQIDPVFLPRIVHKVDTLPRNETGKLPHSEMKALLRALVT